MNTGKGILPVEYLCYRKSRLMAAKCHGVNQLPTGGGELYTTFHNNCGRGVRIMTATYHRAAVDGKEGGKEGGNALCENISSRNPHPIAVKLYGDNNRIDNNHLDNNRNNVEVNLVSLSYYWKTLDKTLVLYQRQVHKD